MPGGRFSKPITKQPGLEPTEALLRQHTLVCDALPAIHAGKSRVSRSLDLVAGVELEAMLCAASHPARHSLQHPSSYLSFSGGWDIFEGL